jgi:hypothetical protein
MDTFSAKTRFLLAFGLSGGRYLLAPFHQRKKSALVASRTFTRESGSFSPASHTWELNFSSEDFQI